MKRYIKDIRTLCVHIASPLFLLLAMGKLGDIKETVALNLYSIITEIDANKLDSRKNPDIEERIIKASIGVMTLYMIHVLLKGDRLLSTFAFIIFTILVLIGYLLRRRAIPTPYFPNLNKDIIATIPQHDSSQIIRDS